MNLNSANWGHVFKMAKQICRENKLKEFQYKYLHRIMVTKKELCRFGIKQDSNCIYCRNEDSIEHFQKLSSEAESFNGSITLITLIIKFTISSIVIGLKNSYFPLIHLPSCYRTVVIGQFVIGQFNKPITFKVVV